MQVILQTKLSTCFIRHCAKNSKGFRTKMSLLPGGGLVRHINITKLIKVLKMLVQKAGLIETYPGYVVCVENQHTSRVQNHRVEDTKLSIYLDSKVILEDRIHDIESTVNWCFLLQEFTFTLGSTLLVFGELLNFYI